MSKSKLSDRQIIGMLRQALCSVSERVDQFNENHPSDEDLPLYLDCEKIAGEAMQLSYSHRECDDRRLYGERSLVAWEIYKDLNGLKPIQRGC